MTTKRINMRINSELLQKLDSYVQWRKDIEITLYSKDDCDRTKVISDLIKICIVLWEEIIKEAPSIIEANNNV